MNVRAWLVSVALVVSGLVSITVGTASASAVDCTPLDAAGISFGAPRLSGQVPALSTVCYSLPGGTTSALDLKLWSGYSSVAVVDSLDQEMCSASPDFSAICALSGTAPYRLLIVNGGGSAIPYDFSVFALDTCPDLQASGFGTAAELFAGTVPAGGLKCRSLTLAPGTYLMTGTSSSGRGLRDATTGAQICHAIYESDDRCQVTGGVYSLLVGASDYEKASYAVAMVDLNGTAGCTDVASTSWTAAAMTVGPLTDSQWDCHLLTADPGDRVVVDADSGVYESPVHLLVLDSAGESACPEVSQTLGCTLIGTGPYRIVTGDDVGYRVAARSLAADAGCPLITARTFGKAADDTHAGVGCRRFEGVAGHRYFLASLTVKGKDALASVYGPDFVRLGFECDGGFPLCAPTQDGTHWVISSVLGKSTVTAFADLAATGGCKAQAANLTQRTKSIGVGEFDCATLDLPAGATLGIVRDITALNGKPTVTVVDSTGEFVCSTYGGDEISLQRCQLTSGVAPYRAIVGLGAARPHTSTAYLRLDKPRGCATIKQGKSATLKVSAKVLARCYVASQGRVRNERLSLRRTSGKAIAELGAATGTGGVCSPYVRGASMTAVCLMLPVTSPFTVVVTGNRKPGTFVLKRGK